MEINDFASKVEKAYNNGKNKPGFNTALNYIQDVVRKDELKNIEAKKVINEREYEK